MSDSKKAFILMPFQEPFDSYYPAIFKPSLEEAGYEVSRADDLLTPSPIMLDIQRSILEADLVLCEMSGKNPNVFYELGLAHASGKPAILVSHKEEDIPFDLRHVRVILYDYSKAGWEEKLRRDIKTAVKAVEESDRIWPPPLIAYKDSSAPIRSISSEIKFNLQEIDKFLSHEYVVEDGVIHSRGQKNVYFNYITCMISVFESSTVQEAISSLDDKLRSQIFQVYQAFRDINNRADALKKVFRIWRVAQYIESIESFNNNIRSTAENLQMDLSEEKEEQDRKKIK